MRSAEYRHRMDKIARVADPPKPPDLTIVWVEAAGGRPTGRTWEQHGFDGPMIERGGDDERNAAATA